MANIATVFVRLYLRDGGLPGVSDIEILSALLNGDGGGQWGGRSYCVPIVLGYAGGARCIDVQYGARWSPGGSPDGLYGLVGGRIRSLWVRWFDSGADYDEIYAIDASGESEHRFCRYGFDAIRAHRAHRESRAPGDAWPEGPLPFQASGDAILVTIAGSYLTGNDRSNLSEEVIPTMTTPAGAMGGSLTSIDPPEAQAFVTSCEEWATRIEWLWRGRVVHTAVRSRTPKKDRGLWEWYQYSMDDWDNCVDTALLRSTGASPFCPARLDDRDRAARDEWLHAIGRL
jgi:hypothetical protein